jgi:hypothetical protein
LLIIPARNIYERFITLEVGKDGEDTRKFQVCRALLCFQSGSFNNLLNGGFKESGSDTVRLQDISIASFKVFFRWLNCGTLRALGDTDTLDYACIFELYGFAEFHIIPRLKNVAIDEYLYTDYHNWTLPHGKKVKRLYDATPRNCPMQKLLLDSLLKWGNFSIINESYPIDFLVDICKAIGKRGDRPLLSPTYATKERWYESTKGKLCDYHDHIEPNSTRPRAS